MAIKNSYVAGNIAMQLEGSDVGFVMSFEGGEPFGEVVDESPNGVRVGKNLGALRYAPIVVEVGGSMESSFYAWVSAMLDGNQTAKSGAIILLDYDNTERSRIEWKSAVITEVAFPQADGSDKQSARFRITIQPESTFVVAGTGAKYQSKLSTKQSKSVLGSNFRFTISGLEAATKGIIKVASLVVRRTEVLDVADLVCWISQAEAAPIDKWFEDFVIAGNNDSSRERKATLTFLDPSLKNELMSVQFEDVGIFRVSRERQEDKSEAIARVKVEMYCEAVRLEVAKTPPAPPPVRPVPPVNAQANAAVESFAAVLVAALRGGSIATVPTAEVITERLLATLDPAPALDEGDRGRVAGRTWAAEHARLAELEEIAVLAERDTWTALALAEGHSLVAFLAATGVLRADEVGPLDLRRDDFTFGIVTGAAAVHQSVVDMVRQRRPPKG
jgi:hypothetical protein